MTVTVTGTPGHHYAVVGSSTGAGFSYAGVAQKVGPDVGVFGIGVLDEAGHAEVTVTPRFVGTTLDRYDLQAATSASPAFCAAAALRQRRSRRWTGRAGGFSRSAGSGRTARAARVHGLGPVMMWISVNTENFTPADNNIWRTLTDAYGFAIGCGATDTRVMRISATEYRLDAGLQNGAPFFDSGFVYSATVSSRVASPATGNAHFAFSGPTDGVLLYVYLSLAGGFSVTVF